VKLHAILKQQQCLNQQDQKEKQLRGISAASDAVNAIKELLVQYKGRVVEKGNPPRDIESSNMSDSSPSHFKDHQVTSLDRLMSGGIGPRMFVLLGVLGLVFFFFKVNSLISEIPAAVEKKKVGEVLSGGVSSGGAMLVSGSEVKVPVGRPTTEGGTDLRSEIEQLRQQVAEYKQVIHGMKGNGSHELPVDSEPADAGIGAVRNEVPVEVRLRALQESVGVVNRK
jgi:hypothetical protein